MQLVTNLCKVHRSSVYVMLWTFYKVSLVHQALSQKLSKLIDPCGTTPYVHVITNRKHTCDRIYFKAVILLALMTVNLRLGRPNKKRLFYAEQGLLKCIKLRCIWTCVEKCWWSSCGKGAQTVCTEEGQVSGPELYRRKLSYSVKTTWIMQYETWAAHHCYHLSWWQRSARIFIFD